MSPRLTISNLVLKRLENLDQGAVGRLYGVCDDKSILVLGLSLSAVGNSGVEELQAFNHDATLHLPGGIVHCGLFTISDENDSHINNEKLLGDSEYPLIISLDAKSKKLSAALLKKGTFEKHDITPINQKEILKELTHLRLTATIPLRCDLEITQVESVLDEFEKKVLSGNVAFQFEDKEIYIFGDKPENISGIGSKCSIIDLLKALNENNQRNSGEDNNFIRVQMFMDQTNHDKTPQTAPYIKYIKKEFKHAEIQFSLDALLTVPKSLPIVKLYCFLIDGTHRNFTLNRNNLLSQLKKGKIYDVCSPETYHFLPSDLAHFFSIVYSPKESVDDLKATRESFHKMLSLAMDRPLFRQANAYEFCSTNKSASNLLLNPHEKLGKSGVSDGEPYLVQGTYAYHHYMQDGFDDNGWGCAYRSLQTIFSWFRFQGYTNKAVPTHKEIQQCLVNIKDKPVSFIGSRQWIGSTEVSFVLDSLLGVTSRIVNVSSGEEMSMKGGELSHHFRTQGTPIMIGGGVLAHTILGVDYNKNTGDIKFLILDPHYTGEEDLGIVLKKGWCGWKGPEFWKKDAFYNMCLPLKPKCV